MNTTTTIAYRIANDEKVCLRQSQNTSRNLNGGDYSFYATPIYLENELIGYWYTTSSEFSFDPISGTWGGDSSYDLTDKEFVEAVKSYKFRYNELKDWGEKDVGCDTCNSDCSSAHGGAWCDCK